MVFKTADVGKAAVLGFGKKRSIMELQNLQEALKVEIQIHQKLVSQMKQDPQNADLKLQLRDLQAKITALSERQKKVVEQLRRDLLVKQEDMKLQTLQADGQTSTLLITQTPLPAASLTTPQSSVSPVIASKTLPLVLRAATPSSPIIMTPAPTITVVTTLGNALLAGPPNSDPQKSPVNFQPVIQPTNQGAEPVRVISNSTIVVQAASQTIKVPQFVPPTRQTTRPATLPQVRPKPPASLSPAAGQISVQTLQSPVLLSTALPSSGHVQQMRILNGLPCPNSSNNTSILISPSTHMQPSVQTRTQQLPHNRPSSDNTIPAVEYATEPKTSLLISPDTPTHTSPPLSLHTPSSPAPTNTHTSSSKHQESPLKLAFMLSLGLVTRDYLEEIQSRRQERKRRTTANPIYSGAMFEPERKKSSVSYLSSINQSSRKRANEDSLSEILQKEDAIEWPGTLAIVHSYISYKAAKEGEKDRLKTWSTELRQERETLEDQVGHLSNSITRCMDSKNSVLAQQREMEASLEKMKGLVRLIRGIQLSPFICPGLMANGEMSHNGASKASSSSAVTTDTNNNTNTATSSSEAMIIIGPLTNTSDTLNQIATNNNVEAASAKSDEGSEENAQIISTSRIRSEPTNANATAFSNNSSNQAVLSTNGTMPTGEEGTKKHKNNNNSDLSVIPQGLLGPIVPLTEVTEGVK
ncbi:PHD finger protein 21Aa isoform X7 [Rhinichthys klamathensis goyatoka]|uniref:PHD finger protein 21Aa isoform X7 n=1 Tax=Rhinichthys klamathensis goyatoka TaxID=3034132 RepID=UPI0024B54ACE|nr:PHD finger protein 21Aa isoform X7 [Rhinichthys klamathensis goyatoka]